MVVTALKSGLGRHRLTEHANCRLFDPARESRDSSIGWLLIPPPFSVTPAKGERRKQSYTESRETVENCTSDRVPEDDRSSRGKSTAVSVTDL
ncbi:hypothetical protein K0M31_012021 [Melipona bicolor]|uniref:Uncharacterized protein n=1 Tax=Melipona bicolor TaxID=60889 RepID=A0AA40KVJ9_9HYME|nr:hypothetical protein K0M31_012021 [Melipona bicolor]